MDKQSRFTHMDDSGNAVMVDVGGKHVTRRRAVAAGRIRMSATCFDAVLQGAVKKGDVLAVAQVAGIMAAKRAHELIPMCHPLCLTGADIAFTPSEAPPGIRIVSTVRVVGETGVEMEALTAASVAALTIYDMAKAVEKGMTITGVRLLKKSGGKSGDYQRAE